MGFIGKSEKELKQIAADLDNRQTALDNRDSNTNSKEKILAHERSLLAAEKDAFESERSDYASEVKRVADGIAAEKADLEKRRSEIALLEAKASANFADTQRKMFKEVIEKRQAELDAHHNDLDALAADVANRLEALHAREGDLARRELAVTEREQKADAGFADKAKMLAEEATRQHKANQDEAERLRKIADAASAERKDLEDNKSALAQREQGIIAAEQRRDAGFADERAALHREIAAASEKKHAALEEEIAELRTKRLVEVTKAEQSERERIRAEIIKERDSWTKQQDETHKRLECERTELEKQKGAVSALQSEVEGRKAELETAEQMIERKEQRSKQQWQKRNDEIEESIEARLDERRKSMELAESANKQELSRLRDSLRIQTELAGAFDQLKRQLGGKDPAEVIREINSQTDELKRLHEELATRPTEEMRERYQALESEAKLQKARADKLVQEIANNNAAVAEVSDLRRGNSELSADNKSLAQKASMWEASAKEAQAELKRLHSAYERPSEVAARYKEIEMPHIRAEVKQPTESDIDEITWLTGVGNACEGYGLHFNPRILKAFHTALKTAEWSPLTVLAGVSGTGKSELPRLYSHFGGLLFEPLSVQPNWDSQESMLGFFNSIDNKFDAQPLLRFLAQSQQSGNESYDKRIERWQKMSGNYIKLDPGSKEDNELIEALKESNYPGLKDCVCLVLLDEMNLAHPELYFAEFLSKLELRRGIAGTDPLPFLPVKIGAGMPPYQLPLGRNVLWTGTMNQDETTKSLSDKVLDRSIIIHFPRPTELKRRLKLERLNEKNRGHLLHKSTWQNWLAQGSSFTEDEVKPFKLFIEEMNRALAGANRAVGHRVWQSIEYYMANYPDVQAAKKSKDPASLKAAMRIAFEDQLVQKVMPKLRGIDTRSISGKKCLEGILGQIVTDEYDLVDDFNLARGDLGYGQFMWHSANYLRETNVGSIPDTAPETEAGPEPYDQAATETSA